MNNSKLILINSFDQFKSLEADWNQLYQESNRSTIFSSWDWMITWWEIYHDQFKRELFILCLYNNEKLVGLAPFQIDKSFPMSLIQGSTLRFIGTGSSKKDSVVSEYLDFIVLPDFEKEFIALVSEYLLENKKKWRFADFELLLKDALVIKCFNKSSNESVSQMKTQYGVRFVIPEMDSYTDYQENLSSRWRKALARKSRKLANDGESNIETTDSIESLEIALKRLADMHCSRWKDKTDYCIFDSSRFYRFHQKILSRLHPLNKASIKTLTIDGEALASYYSFEDKGIIYYYQSGFYKKYANRYSPLFLLLCSGIESAIKNKKTFDFMFDENPESYKKNQYSAVSHKMYKLKWSHQPYRLFMYNKIKELKAISLKYYTLLRTRLGHA